MEKFLIAFDLDGTILNNDSKLDQETIDTLRHLNNQGHIIMLATGRPHHACIEFYKEIGLKTPLISDNGASIRFLENGKGKFSFITNKMIKDLFEYTKDYTGSAFFSDGKFVYSYKESRFIHFGYPTDKVPVKYIDFDQYEGKCTNIMLQITADKMEYFESYINTKYKGKLAFRLWGSDHKNAIYEIFRDGVSKGNAIKYVLEFYGLNHDYTMCFGDGLNDLEMLSYVKYSVAMKNGGDDVKNNSKYVTEFNNNELGVVKFIKKFFKI